MRKFSHVAGFMVEYTAQMNTGSRELPTRRVAVVGVVGRTNAGKSTIVNRMVGEKVSIVSPVEQTTRNTIRGIVADARGQLVLQDTPGLHKAVGPLGKLLNGMARASSAGVDILCVVFDAAHEPQLEDEGWMSRVARERPEKCIFVLNKYDCTPFYETMFYDLWKDVSSRPALCAIPSTSPNPPSPPTWIKACGVRPDGCDALMDALFNLAPKGSPLFPEDIVTDYPRRLAMADVVREKLLQRLYHEVPHEIGVVVKDIREDRHSWDVSVTVYVNHQSQKGIVIGPGGRLLKAVRQSAEPELSEMFNVKVRLELWVKVEPQWMKNNRLLGEMGYLGAVR